MKWLPLGTSFSPPGGVEILSMGKLKWPFEPWMSMNQKFGYVAWRGPKSFTKSSKKNFGSGPFLILQDHLNFFRSYFEPQKKGEPPHSVFFAGSHNCHKRPATEARKARLAGLAQIFLKTESTKIGHFFQWKIHHFEGIFQDMETLWQSSVVVFKAANDHQVQLPVTSCFSRK